MAVTPTREQFETFANHEREGEVVMINVLHFVPSEGSGTFVDMVTTSEYQGVHRDRERGLDRSVLLACEPIGDWTASHA